GDGIIRYFHVKYGIPRENLLAGNGSTEIIYLLPRALGLKRVLVVSLSYNDYSRASLLSGARVDRDPLTPETLFSSLDVDKISNLLRYSDALWLGNPNNPTGSLFNKQTIMTLADRYPEQWFIIDEAFMPFVEDDQNYSFMEPPSKSNVVVIRSLTKFYALAGIRLGGAVAHSDVITRLKRLKEPWTVNGPAEKIALHLIDTGHYEDETRHLVKKERGRLIHGLQSIPGIEPYPSGSNFILCQWKRSDNLDDLIGHLLSRGIYIRDCRNFPELEDNYFRLAVRTAAENAKLMSAMTSLPDGYE
ncbi:MAG: pyridoxal phosphate-dependent class II aminotransferase, partial [Deltaproteobacteria bacterium]|nr:pyridoxal phosphate-dependent class II aminotransferase [Deltaproteobacteria bacterium]